MSPGFKCFRTKEIKQFISLMMSGFLILTNLSLGTLPVMAAEVNEGNGVSGNDASGNDASGNDASGNDQQENNPPPYDPTKIDVWDFGAELLDTSIYNNMLTADVINGWYPDVAPGTEGPTLASFTSGDLSFNDGGNSNTHRLRTVNTDLTRKDQKSLTGEDGTVYKGYIYSNSGSKPAVYIGLDVDAGDILTVVVSSNGTLSTITMADPDGQVEDAQDFTLGSGSKAQVMNFYPTATGIYKFYSSNEKLVVARIIREHTSQVTVSGTVTDPAELSGHSLVFTDNDNGAVTEAVVGGDGSYSAQLFNHHDYTVTLKNANGYIITVGSALTLAKGAGATTFNVTVEGVPLTAASGTISGLPSGLQAKLKVTFKDQDEDALYVPVTNISGSNYTVSLQEDHTYDIESSGMLTSQVNDTANDNKVVMGLADYQLSDASAVSVGSSSITRNLAYALKPYYDVTIDPEGATAANLSAAKFTFTNLNEDGYEYTFTGTDSIALRNGTYEVSVRDSGRFAQELTSNLTVSNGDVTKAISFDGNVTQWDFKSADFTGKYSTYSKLEAYNGLTFAGDRIKYHSAGLNVKNATITVPVSGNCQIAVTGCNKFEFYFANNSSDLKVANISAGSTSKFDTYTYDYVGGAGTVDITVTNTADSYLTKIEVLPVLAYDSTLTVGATGCDYTTINDALEAVRGMDRSAGERVTISIQPGNYEEMLVIDVPDVTLKNASTTPSLALSNKGVDIDANAVRITSYYGHGYSYYSMGSDCKWDGDLLAVNKANGYESFTNPGSGTTSGSYWNATVVITGSGFQAEGIIFENSFNQYVSAKAAADTIVKLSSAKEPASAPRAGLAAGSTAVQDKAYVERAAALAIANNSGKVSFDNCKFVGRQDTLYGGSNVQAAFYDCSVYGGTDYIFGPMTAVFAKCDLVFNTSENNNDVGYITAPQQSSGRGYLMYNCHITSTTPGVDTASEFTSKAGYLGRPWAANTGEAVFYNTIIDATCSEYFESTPSMIQPAGWLSTLSGESARCLEYGTYEYAKDVNNATSRAAWSGGVLSEAKLADETDITVAAFLGDWNAFAGKDMDVVIPTEKVDNTPEAEGVTTEYILDPSQIACAAADKVDYPSGTTFVDGYFKVISTTTNGVAHRGTTSNTPMELSQDEKGKIEFTITGTADVVLRMSSTGSSNKSLGGIKDADGNLLTPGENVTEIVGTNNTEMTYTNLAAGTYYVVSPTSTDSAYGRAVRLRYLKVSETIAPVIEQHLFDPTDIDATGVDDNTAIAEGTTYDSGYFKIVGTVKQRVSSGSTTTVEVGKADSGKLQFTITGTADAIIKLSSTGGSNASAVALKDSSGNVITEKNGITSVSGTSATTLTYEDLSAGTYNIVSPLDASNNRGARIHHVEVNEVTSGVKPPRAAWSTVTTPSITGVTVNASTIAVAFNALIGYDGADKVEVTMYKGEEEIDTASYATEGTSGTVTFTPDASGTYSFTVAAVREDETDKVSTKVTAGSNFVLPLETPYVSSATSVGGGSVSIVWTAVPEADSYEVSAAGTDISKTTTDLSAVLEGLTVGTSYTFNVVAIRGSERSSAGTKTATVSADAQQVWSFSAFGDGVNTTANGSTGDANLGSVRVFSTGGKGKLVPATRDGLAFYYTQLDAADDNFILTATAKVNTWTYSNGQEGFGLMAADAIGTHGDSASFWNNSYMTTVTKVEYFWDTSKNAVSDTGDKISMKLGVGAQEKTGATGPDTDVAAFSSIMTTLDTSCAIGGAGTYNIIGNYAGTKPEGTIDGAFTELKLTLQRDNTGYRLSYTDPDGNTTTKLYYDIERDNLSAIEEDNIYVGFFASRNADVTFEDISLTISDAATDAPAEEREITSVTPVYQITSAATANAASYNLVYRGNADGTLTITDASGTVLVNQAAVTANTDYVKNVTLAKGNNTFSVTMVPDPDYKPSEYSVLANYNAKTFSHTVKYETIARTYIYVAPTGTSSGDGSKTSPLDIYTAVKYAAPGQTILLAGGTYSLSSTVTVDRGISGTEAKPITMAADPEATTRPVFDFNQQCPGMVLAGDYWYFKGFDVTRSSNAQKGVQVSGSHNTLDQINTYYNGNSGIQISRYKSTDGWDNWPSYNLILNCTSYGNADRGYEDADGFAAKLTIGNGNVFDGCIAYNNADDGWDLFAKIESGPIGKVVIKNSVAYGNGYLEDGTNAGNGNGFKMGGSSISGYHTLINSVAFNNKAKGIDSNSCPDIQVENCTTFNNGSYNVAFYTSGAANTDFSGKGLLSYRTASTGVREEIKPKGTQDTAKIYGTTNYYWDETKLASENSAGTAVSSDWFKSLTFTGLSRNANGTINMNGFLELTNLAPADTGARMSGTASYNVVVDPNADKPAPGNTDNGNTDNGNQDDDDDDDVPAEPTEQEVKLQELVDNLVTIQKDAAPAQKAAAAEKLIQALPDSALKNITVDSKASLSLLKKAEAEITALLGTTVEIVPGRNAAENLNLTNVEVVGALLSVPVGQSAEIRVGAPLSAVPDQVGSNFLVGPVAFDLKLYVDDQQTQLSAPVLIRIPVPAGIDTTQEVVVIHILDNGQMEQLKVNIADGYLEFVTSSFSTFVAANLSSQQPDVLASKVISPITYDSSALVTKPVLPTTADPEVSGDSSLWILLLLVVVAFGAVTMGIKINEIMRQGNKEE